jgi:hypothetical protein
MSLKGDKYETADEIRFRLENTVVLYDGKPVYITRVDAGGEDGEIARVFFYDLPLVGNNKETRKFLSSRKFDLTPFKMGYLNYNGEAIFVSRSPVRQNRQGLCVNNTVFTTIKGQRAEFSYNQMIGSSGFIDMVMGTYPDFKTAGTMLDEKGIKSVAVSRSFAFIIDHDLEALLLMHKGVKCGLAMKGDRGLKLPPKFAFLREEMEEHRIPLA